MKENSKPFNFSRASCRATYFVPLSAEQAALQQSQARRTLGMRTCSPIPSPTKTAAAASQSRFETHETSPKMPLYASSRDASKSPASQRSLSPFTPRVRVEHAAAQPAAFLRSAGGEGRSFQSLSVSPPAGGSFSLSNTDKSLDEFWVLEEAEVYARMGIEMRCRPCPLMLVCVCVCVCFFLFVCLFVCLCVCLFVLVFVCVFVLNPNNLLTGRGDLWSSPGHT